MSTAVQPAPDESDTAEPDTAEPDTAEPDTAEAPAPVRYLTRIELGVAVLIAPVIVAIAWASRFVVVTPELHTTAAFVHLACVVVGFGAVLVVDWFGLRWQFGRASLERVVSVAGELAVPIWCGLAGLVLSGLFLEPALDSTTTRVKIAMVAVAGLIGMLALVTQRRMRATLPFPSPSLVRRAMMLAVASQVCWWGATVIGFLNRT